jgi:hypothetical protein
LVLSSTSDRGDDGPGVSAGPVKHLALLLVEAARKWSENSEGSANVALCREEHHRARSGSSARS